MKTILLTILLSILFKSTAPASGAITIEITTTDSKTAYTLHKRGYGNDFKSATPREIESWVHSIIPKIADPGLRIYIYTDVRTPFTHITDMLRRLKVDGAKSFVVCAGTNAKVQPELAAKFEDIRIAFRSSRYGKEEAEQEAVANP